MEVMAVKVLPAPVAIWIRARGRSALNDSSRLVMAVILAVAQADLAGVERAGCGAGARAAMRSAPAIPCSVSGRWKLNTSRERGLGSRPSVKRVMTPVLS